MYYDIKDILPCLILISSVIAQDEIFNERICALNEDCDSCMRSGDFCNWCDDYTFNLGTMPSCNTKENLLQNGCPKGSILENNFTFKFITEDKPLSDFETDSLTARQIKPQRVSVEIKPGDTHSIHFEYTQAKNYPLDLYYLMDLTWSMRDDKETLVGLKLDLPVVLKKLTKNFRLGFGSFADKPVLPFIAMDPKRRQNPCSVEFSTCEPTYTFRHRLNFTNEVNKFVSAVNESSVTASLDNLEATVEGLMQILVCGEKIGWSNRSRKIVIVVTDGKIHFAGMGKLGGIVKRNDERCHLENDGTYPEEFSTSMDYPSLSQIDRILNENKINVIFAVTEDVKNYYEKINDLLPDTTYIGKLEADSSNVLNLVKQGYEDFSSVISFIDDAGDFVDIKYFSDCGGDTIMETTKCENVTAGKTYKFILNITMKDCEAKDHGPKTIRVSESQFDNEYLTIDLNLHCKCECSTTNDNKTCPPNSELRCGKCFCLEGWIGPNCECNVNDDSISRDDLKANCISSSKKDGRKGIVCSGAGDCYCGTCFCDDGFIGKFCECKECVKDPKTDSVCGGTNRGVCSCGECLCTNGYEGPTCSCPSGNSTCTLPGDTKPCSGRGKCACGECECDRDSENKYAGKFCEVCTNCVNPGCQLYEECAYAAVTKGTSAAECVSSGTIYVPFIIDDRKIAISTNESSCAFYLEENGESCEYPFTYEVGKDWTVNIRIYPKTCSSLIGQATVYGIPIFLLTIFIGVLGIIIWKITTFYKDKKEFAKFEAERLFQMNSLNSRQENPLYKSPIMEYKMPDNFKIEDND